MRRPLFPMLREGDIVEFRNASHYDDFVDFDQTKSGNIVMRVVCWRDDPKLDECARDNAPWKGTGSRSFPSGASGTPFREDMSTYGFVFTQHYDADGQVLPGAPVPPPRPFAGNPDFPWKKVRRGDASVEYKPLPDLPYVKSTAPLPVRGPEATPAAVGSVERAQPAAVPQPAPAPSRAAPAPRPQYQGIGVGPADQR